MNRIRDLRLSRDLSQVSLGKALGCTSATISKYELEQRQLDPATINALCDYFGVTSDYLLCRSNTPTIMLTDDEAELLRAYRASSEDAKAVVNLTLKPYMGNADRKDAVS